MGAVKLRGNTTFTQYEEQEVSLRSLDVLPELLQVRARLDKGWSLEYSKGYARGDTFPPILVFRLPDGRRVVADGFHRVDACLAIGMKTIRAQIRDGTMHEALLAAIEANTSAFHRGRPFGDDDRRHAAEMLFADPECLQWSNQMIAKHCGLSSVTVGKYKKQYALKNNVDLPTHVVTERGFKRPAHTSLTTGEPAISSRSNRPSGTSFVGTFNGRHFYGSSADEVASRISKEKEAVQVGRVDLKGSGSFRAWLLRRGVLAEPVVLDMGPDRVACIKVDVAILASLDIIDVNSILAAVGKLRIFRLLEGMAQARLIVVCYADGHLERLVELARQDGIEFLTPEELVASLKGQEGGEESSLPKNGERGGEPPCPIDEER